MKLRLIVTLQVASLVAAFAACTVRTSDSGSHRDADGVSTRAGDTPGSDTGDAGRTSDASTEAARRTSTVPPALADTRWTWVTSSGAHQLAFASDGEYTSDVFLNAHPGESCGTEYATHREGTATFTDATLTLTSTISTRTKTDSCSGKILAKDAIDQDTTSYVWRVEAGDAGPEALVLESTDGQEVRYARD